MTASSDARVRVRAVDTPAKAPESAGVRETSAHARAISRITDLSKGRGARVSTSLHVVEAAAELKSGWAATEAPPPPAEMWRQVFPSQGEATSRAWWVAMSVAGLFRAVVISGLWLAGLAVSTRIRAGVGLTVVVVLACAGCVASALHH